METKACQSCKNDFRIESDDLSFYEKIGVPAPTWCPECRNIQRLATRNAKSIYKRNCDKCGASVVSRFSPDNPAKMYCRDCWWGDGWDALDHGKEYDFSKSFFEQFRDLLFAVPHVSILSNNMVESQYSNMESDDKRCYLTFGGHYNEDCCFSEYSLHGKEVYDSYWSFNGEQCLGNTIVERCYRTFFSTECYDCIDTSFSFDCHGCSNIIGCAGLRKKSYCIFNKQYSREEFLKEKAKYDLGSHQIVDELIENSKEVWHNTPHRDKRAIKAVNCTGNYIVNSKNSSNVWQAEDLQDCKNIYIGAWEKDCQDETSCGNDELCYLCANGGGLYNCIAVLYSFGANVDKQKHTFNSGYSCTILNCTDCFGCIGLRNKQYCIFNKQYAKEEYFELLARIREHMKDMPFVSPITGQVFSFGDFFPPEHSLFAYNETAANDFYPKDRAAAEGQGFLWREEEVSQHKFSEYEIPDNIKDVSDDILNQVLKCEFSGKAYKITKQELEFYRKAVLPIPRVAPMERIRRRVLALTPFRSFDRICQCTGSAPTERYQNTITHDHGAGVCGKKIETSYSPARPELVYCEQCYQQEMA